MLSADLGGARSASFRRVKSFAVTSAASSADCGGCQPFRPVTAPARSGATCAQLAGCTVLARKAREAFTEQACFLLGLLVPARIGWASGGLGTESSKAIGIDAAN